MYYKGGPKTTSTSTAYCIQHSTIPTCPNAFSLGDIWPDTLKLDILRNVLQGRAKKHIVVN